MIRTMNNRRDTKMKEHKGTKGYKQDDKEVIANATGATSTEQLPEQQKILELTNDLKRLQAEFENYKKRVDKEKQEMKEYYLKEFVSKLLPVIDSFEIA